MNPLFGTKIVLDPSGGLAAKFSETPESAFLVYEHKNWELLPLKLQSKIRSFVESNQIQTLESMFAKPSTDEKTEIRRIIQENFAKEFLIKDKSDALDKYQNVMKHKGSLSFAMFDELFVVHNDRDPDVFSKQAAQNQNAVDGLMQDDFTLNKAHFNVIYKDIDSCVCFTSRGKVMLFEDIMSVVNDIVGFFDLPSIPFVAFSTIVDSLWRQGGVVPKTSNEYYDFIGKTDVFAIILSSYAAQANSLEDWKTRDFRSKVLDVVNDYPLKEPSLLDTMMIDRDLAKTMIKNMVKDFYVHKSIDIKESFIKNFLRLTS